MPDRSREWAPENVRGHAEEVRERWLELVRLWAAEIARSLATASDAPGGTALPRPGALSPESSAPRSD